MQGLAQEVVDTHRGRVLDFEDFLAVLSRPPWVMMLPTMAHSGLVVQRRQLQDMPVWRSDMG